MAVPGGRNGMEDDGEDADQDLFEEEGDEDAWVDEETEEPPHIGAIADASQRGDVDALRLVIDNHMDCLDLPVEDGDTALHLSCLYGHLPCVQLLLERGANLECKDEEGALPLHDACAGGYTDIIKLLLNSAATGATGQTIDDARKLVAATDFEGDTPLHHAARGEHLLAVQMLLESGASATRKNMFGKIPAELADQDTEVRSVLEAAAAAASSASNDVAGV